MIVTSFFTQTGEYPALAARLAASCDRFGLRHRIMQLSDQGDWRTTNNKKPEVILNTLFEHRCPTLWVDIDTEFLRLPTVFWQNEIDFAVYNWRADPDNPKGFPVDLNSLSSAGGVIFFGYTAPAIELAVRWSGEIHRTPEGVDDQILDKVWAQHRPPLKQLWLPRQANWMTGHFGAPPPDCIIRHDYKSGGHRT